MRSTGGALVLRDLIRAQAPVLETSRVPAGFLDADTLVTSSGWH
jgi:hypothetical protein